MTDRYIDEFSASAVKKLTSLLSVSPAAGRGPPSEEWLNKQREGVKALPQACLRPALDDPLAVITRGLMLASERRDLPFVPHAALLCKAHKSLHPWRLRSLFLLLADEVGMKSDRIRRHKGFDGLPPSQSVQAFVRRMTSISSLWLRADDFQRRFGFPADMLPFIEGGCEACMLAMVGARGELLADLRANIIARTNVARHHPRMRSDPAFLRFVDAWIDWFGDDKVLLISVSDKLAVELQTIRETNLRERRERRDARKRLKEAGKKISNPNIYRGRNPLPRPASLIGEPSKAHGAPLGTDHAARNGQRGANLSFNEQQQDRDQDGDGVDQHAEDWADEVGSYYFTRDEPARDNINTTTNTENESDHNPGARANWKPRWQSVTPSGPVHPAFRQNARGVKVKDGSLSIVGEDTASTQEKLRQWFRSSMDLGSGSRRPSHAGSSSSRRPSVSGSSRSRRPSAADPEAKVPEDMQDKLRMLFDGTMPSPSATAGRSTFSPGQTSKSSSAQTQPSTAPSSPSHPNSPRGIGGYGNFNLEHKRYSQEVRERYENNIWTPSKNRQPTAESVTEDDANSSAYTDVSAHTRAPVPDSTLLSGLVRGENPGEVQGGIRSNYNGALRTDEATLAILEGRIPPVQPPGRISVRQMMEARIEKRERRDREQGRTPRPSSCASDAFRNPFIPEPLSRRGSNATERPPPLPNMPRSPGIPRSPRAEVPPSPRASSSVYSQDSGDPGHDRGRQDRRSSRSESRSSSRASRNSESTNLGMFLRDLDQNRPVVPEDSISAVGERRREEERQREKKEKPRRGLDMLFRRK